MPSSSSAATSSGSTASSAGSAKGVCKKCTVRRSGRRSASIRPEEREVVVLHQHGGALGRPLDDHVGHGAVVGPVAVPGRPPVAVEPGPMRQVEEMVVHVPQRRVGDDVIGLAVGLVVHHHRDEVEAVLVHEARATASRSAAPIVTETHVVPLPARSRCSDEARPPPAGTGSSGAVGPGPEAQRAAVGDDDRRAHRSAPWRAARWSAHRRAHARRGTRTAGPARGRRAARRRAWGRSSCERPVAVDALAEVDLGQPVGAELCATSISRPSSTP